MTYETITYNVHDRIATITLNRAEKMNSFTGTMMDEWADAINRAAEDTGVRVVIVTGAGRAFCAGVDLSTTGAADRVMMSESEPADRRNSLRFTVHRVSHAIQYLDKPYIAAINGVAAGAGMDMCSQADIRIASEQARFGMSYANVGLVPGDGGSWLLPRLVGVQRALDLIWAANFIDAQTALEIGYVLKVVPHESLMDEAIAYAQKLLQGPGVAQQLAKRLVYRGMTQSFAEALESAQAAMTIAQSSPDFLEGRTAFGERRPPQFLP